MEDEMTAKTQAPRELVGGTLIQGRYEVRDQLGSGGFATVYRAFDVEIERDVAVKVLDLAMLKDQRVDNVLARFRQEAKLAARIRHPGVVQIVDFGVIEAGEQPFIVMEYLEGHDLEVELMGGPMTPSRALPLFCNALEALGEAHELGIVHKDLKPSNLFLSEPESRRESLRIVDFGIAHIGEESQSRLTATGHMLGTPAYMAPEYAETKEVTAAVDVYQMGLILVEMFTGRPLVDHDNPLKCVMSHVSGELFVPAPLLSGPLGPVLEKALAREPSARYPDGYAFLAALREVSPDAIAPVPASSHLERLGASSSTSSGDVLPQAPNTLEDLALQDTMAMAAVPAIKGPSSPPIATEPLPEKRSNPAILFAGLFLLGALLVAAGFLLRPGAGGGGEDATGAELAAAAISPAEEDDLSRGQLITLTSEPSGAEIWHGDERLGETPYEYAVDDEESFAVALRLEGYEEEKVSFGPDLDPEIHVRLSKIPEPAAEEVAAPTPKTRAPEAKSGKTTRAGRKGKGRGKEKERDRKFTIFGEDR